jgi:hypothetical protein
MCVVLDDDEVSSDEDEPLQKRLRQLSGIGPVGLDEAAATDKEATGKRATEEAATKRAVEERAVKEATVKVAVAEEVASKTTDEAVGAAGGSPAPIRCPQRPGPRELRLQVVPPRQPNVPTGVFGNLSLSSFLSPFSPFFSFFCGASFSDYPFFLGPLPPTQPPRWARLSQMRLSG